MGLWRPATKIRFWTPKVRNRSYVQPPALLKLISALCVFSIVGTIIYYLVVALGDVVSGSSIEPTSALYVSILHFLLPLLIAVAISTNSGTSRILIVAYFLILGSATALGKGFLGSLAIDETLRATLAIGLLVSVSAYLYLGSKARAYYALLSGDEVPTGVGDEAVELVENPWPGERGRAVIEWLVDHLETIVILGLIVAVILGWRSMTPS